MSLETLELAGRRWQAAGPWERDFRTFGYGDTKKPSVDWTWRLLQPTMSIQLKAWILSLSGILLCQSGMNHDPYYRRS